MNPDSAAQIESAVRARCKPGVAKTKVWFKVQCSRFKFNFFLTLSIELLNIELSSLDLIAHRAELLRLLGGELLLTGDR